MKKKLQPHMTILNNGKIRLRYQKSKKFPEGFDQVFNNYEDAEIHFQKIEKEIKEQKRSVTEYDDYERKQKDIGFCDFCDLYVEYLMKKTKRLKPQTVRSYIKYIRILKSAIGNRKVSTMDELYLIDLLDKESRRQSQANGAKEGQAISSNTLKHEYTMLNSLFIKMRSWHYIKENPMKDIEPPEVISLEKSIPEFTEMDSILEKLLSAPLRERCQFLLGFYTGIREEEVCGLHIEDIDVVECLIHVNQVVIQDLNGNYIEDTPKSKSSIRCVPFPPEFLDTYNKYLIYRRNFIEYLQLKNPKYKEIPNLFLNKNGDLYRPSRISRLFSRFVKQEEINISLTFHGLRHYYLSNQVNYNSDLSEEEKKSLAGHSNINTTRIYVHASQKNINKNAINIFYRFNKERLYKNGKDCYTIPIDQILSIIIGNPQISKLEELKITLEEVSRTKIDFYNISEIIETCKEIIISANPALARIEKYKYDALNNGEILKKVQQQFGKEVIVIKK